MARALLAAVVRATPNVSRVPTQVVIWALKLEMNHWASLLTVAIWPGRSAIGELFIDGSASICRAVDCIRL